MNTRELEKVEIRQHISDDASAAPIIKHIALQVLMADEGKDIPLRHIRHYVQELTDRSFSPGSFSGAMRDLVEESNGKVTNPERGIYRYEKSVKKTQINDLIDTLITSLDEIAIDNILKISDEDLTMIRKIPNIQNELEKLKL